MNDDFIFCPFCGESSWLTEKFRNYEDGRLESYKCSNCKNFTYTNIIKPITSKINQLYNIKYSIEAEVGDYLIHILYEDKGQTQIKNRHSWVIIITLNKIVHFNWYKIDDVISKVKKYVLFS